MSDVSSPYFSYLELLREVYRDLGAELPEAEFIPGLPLGFNLNVDGVDITIAYNPARDEQVGTVYATFGRVPEQGAAEALHRLMELNFVLAQEKAAVLSVNPDTQSVIYQYDFFLDDVTAESLLNSVALVAAQAKKWRTSYFLDNDMSATQGGDTWHPGLV